MVQAVSIAWCSSKNRSVYSLNSRVAIMYPTRVVIRTNTNIAWSWKNVNCSMSGEALSWNPRADHDAISYVVRSGF